jgi:hypothetical protein
VTTIREGTNIGEKKKKKRRYSNLFRAMKNFDKWIFLPLPCYAEPRIFWTLDLETPAQEPKSMEPNVIKAKGC